MVLNRKQKIDKFVRGISWYISHVFETGFEPVFAEEEYVPCEPLTFLFHRCINHHKKHLQLHSYYYVFQENRTNLLFTNFKFELKRAALLMAPLDFLTKCASYIISGSYLKQQGFLEAPDITCYAIYEAFINSEQHHYLDQWFYLEKSKPPIICTISNAMEIDGISVDKFVRSICKYVSHVFETGNVPEYSKKEYAPSVSLTILLNRCINHHKEHLNLHSYEYVFKEDRINILLGNFILELKQAAQLMEPLNFLTKCATYIIAGSFLKQHGFLEAPDISCVAIYQAFVESDQHKYLKPWFYVGKTKNSN